MNSPHHQEHFNCAFSVFYTKLKEAYRNGINSASDKEYAAEYFRTILFEENDAIPAKTIFFDELRSLFDHFQNLYGDSAILRVMEHLEPIREKSRNAMEQLARFRDGLGDPDYMQLPAHYDWQIDYGADSGEIIEEEKQVLALSDQQIAELLGLHSAIRKLYAEIRPGTASPEREPEPQSDRNDRFTRSQQVLVFHFLMEATGINHNGANITDCARLLHKLIGVPEPKEIANSDLYKKLKNPTGDYDRKTLLDLRAILPYFEKLPHYPIMKLINDHLRSCDGD